MFLLPLLLFWVSAGLKLAIADGPAARIHQILRRAVSYESATPIPCVLGCRVALDSINACADTFDGTSVECGKTCSQTDYNLTVQCLECTLVLGGIEARSELQDVLDDLNSLCLRVNPFLEGVGSITGSPTTTGPFSTSTDGNTLTLEIWTGLTAYVTSDVTSGTGTGVSVTTTITDTETGLALPSVISTPEDSGTSRTSSVRTTGGGGTTSGPSPSAPAASSPNTAWHTSDPSLLRAGMTVILLAVFVL